MRRAASRLGLFIVAALSLGTRAPQVVPQGDFIAWSADRKLDWPDFRAKAPGSLSGAQSVLGFNYALGCRRGALEATFTAVFYPDQSYVARRIATSGLASRIGLRHEQLHFDIKELYARRLRKHFAEIENPCPLADDTLDAMTKPIMRTESAAQRRFDVESHNGEREDTLIEWERQIAADLIALKAFAR